ncbi:Uncharacterised protein [Mycobacterium tuberculosis]|nr:Uncharacterised protein [Mycobacterium tuberculosis]
MVNVPYTGLQIDTGHAAVHMMLSSLQGFQHAESILFILRLSEHFAVQNNDRIRTDDNAVPELRPIRFTTFVYRRCFAAGQLLHDMFRRKPRFCRFVRIAYDELAGKLQGTDQFLPPR